jgi:feruloyl esterase
MKTFTAAAAAVACATCFGMAHADKPAAQGMACIDLATLNLPNTKIDSATIVPAGPLSAISGSTAVAPTCSSDVAAPQLPALCRVQGTVGPGQIKFEVWLPLQGWNGKYQGLGNHGFAGNIEYTDMAPELLKGYAVSGTDTGHQGSATAWMQNQQQIVDYGSRGIHEMAVKSKAIVEAFYGKAPKYSYFNGCSTGGKEGLMAAQRYPDDFDGINVAGSANFDQIGNRIQYVWDGVVSGQLPQTQLAGADLTLINKAVLAACDELDGVADGVLDNPLACHFDAATFVFPSSGVYGSIAPGQPLQCTGAKTATCLTPTQVTALKKVYQGPRNPRTSEEIYPGLPRGSELGWNGHTTSPTIFPTAQQFFQFMVYPNNSGNPALDWNYRGFDFDRDTAYAKDHFSELLDAINPDLSAFRKRGSKLLFTHAWSSTVHTATRSIEYYDSVARLLHGGDNDQGYLYGKTQEFFRLFLAPSASGSKGPSTLDSMPALERWVEQGIAPKSLIAVHKTGGVVDRARPLCPYPQHAVFIGDETIQGSIDLAENFVCRGQGLGE